jgi:hypothetical protein
MISDEIKQKLQHIVRGACLQGTADRCTTLRNLLIEGFGADPTVKSKFESRAIVKEKQNNFLKSYSAQSGLLLTSLPPDQQYLTRWGNPKSFWIRID